MRSLTFGAVVALAMSSAECAVLPSACLKRQMRRDAWTKTGEIPAGRTVALLVDYAVEGSQNDLSIAWDGQGQASGPRLRVFATRAECTTVEDAVARRGVCAQLGSGAGSMSSGEFVQRTLIIANGRGNRDVIGPTAQYRLWIVGDAQQATNYTITSASFYGPDC